MAQFEPLTDQIKAMGAQVIFVAAEKRDGMHKPLKFLAQRPISFPFLLDEDRSVTKAFGLYHRIGLDAINIARPATLVIDCAGIIQYLYSGNNQHDRAPMERVLEATKKLHSI